MARRAAIIGTGSFFPPKVVTNNDLTKVVETSDEWIRSRSGIEERHVTDYATATSDLATEAGKKALAASGVDPLSVELIVVGTTSPDTLFPSVGAILQDRLGLKKAVAFDVSAACSGFNYALTIASAFIENGTYNNVLVVGADTLTKYVDWTDRSTCVLFGDAAGAVVLTAKEDGSGVLSNYLYTDGAGGKDLVMPGGGSRDPEMRNGRFIKMNGKEVFKFAVRALEASVVEVVKKAGLELSQISCLIPHQANIRIIDHVIKKLGFPAEKVFVNLQKYGNTSAASIPLALDEAVKAGKIKKGDIVVLAGFGAGLTAGANVIKW
ncbi:MAG: ketoacyl-ACP synthase III [Candidatus Saganbacteria bacterium]|nr:ketoacyl-ACP synthase III [Candidatus Saganbacteria bacterium]